MTNKFKISPEIRFKLYLMRCEMAVFFLGMESACKKACDSVNDFGKAMGKIKGIEND